MDADPRAIQQIIFTAKARVNIMIYYILEQSKETLPQFSKGAIINGKYKWLNALNVKLADTQLKKLKIAVKDKTGTTLRISLKILNGNDLPYELLLTIRQKITICQLI